MAAPSSSPSAEAEYWRIRAMAQQVRLGLPIPGALELGMLLGVPPEGPHHQAAFHSLGDLCLLSLTSCQDCPLPETSGPPSIMVLPAISCLLHPAGPRSNSPFPPGHALHTQLDLLGPLLSICLNIVLPAGL